jgi:hypothetical protein
MACMVNSILSNILGAFVGGFWWYTIMGILLVVLIIVYVQLKKKGAA